MPGDPEFQRQPGGGPLDRSAKTPIRDKALTVVQGYFPNAVAAGQYSIAFSHKGHSYSMRITFDAIRLSGDGSILFSVGEGTRDMAVMVACTAVKHLL
jgi:hypothetical protein